MLSFVTGGANTGIQKLATVWAMLDGGIHFSVIHIGAVFF
jgi:hypothetical protein